MQLPITLVDPISSSSSLAVALTLLVASFVLALALPRRLSTRARNIEAAWIALVLAVPLMFSSRLPIELPLPLYLVLRLIRAAPGYRLYLVPTALLCAFWLYDRSFLAAVCLSPMACALFFRPSSSSSSSDPVRAEHAQASHSEWTSA